MAKKIVLTEDQYRQLILCFFTCMDLHVAKDKMSFLTWEFASNPFTVDDLVKRGLE